MGLKTNDGAGVVRVRALILCRGAVFLCGHRCFGPLGRCAPPVSAPRSGAARSALSPAQRGKNGELGRANAQKKRGANMKQGAVQVQHCVNTHRPTQTDTRGLSDYNCMGPEAFSFPCAMDGACWPFSIFFLFLTLILIGIFLRR